MLALFFPFLSFIISGLFFAYAPVKYSLLFCCSVTILFLAQTFYFFIKVSNKNYLNFYTIFFFSFFFINFFYPTVLYPIDPEFFSVFKLGFSETYINKGTALSQLASSSFVLGVFFFKSPKSTNRVVQQKVFYLSHHVSTILTLILFFLFVATVGNQFLSGDFTAHSSFSLYILQLLTSFFILSSILFLKYYKYQKYKNFYYLAVLLNIILFVSIGDRGPALYLIILIFSLYAFYIKKISLKSLLLAALFGIVLMHLVGVGRSAGSSNFEGNIISRGIEKSHSEDKRRSFYSVTESFVVNARNLYVGLQYVDVYGINLGETFYISFLSVVPFFQSIFEKSTGITPKGSASFFTELAFGPSPPYGLGTNLVADIYISFGLLGVVILFFFLGLVVEYYRKKVTVGGDIYSNIVYFGMVYFSVYLPRSALLTPLKFIGWSCFLFFILTKIKLVKFKLVK